MKAGTDGGAQGAAKPLAGLKAGLALVGGMVAIAFALAAMIVLPTVLLVPTLSFPFVMPNGLLNVVLGFVALAAGAAFFIGGATARCLAGPRTWGGWMGVASALGFIVILSLLPPRRWIYAPHRGWEAAPTGLPPGAVMVRDFTALLRVIVTVAGATLAWLGDNWAAQRGRRKGKQAGRSVEQADASFSLPR